MRRAQICNLALREFSAVAVGRGFVKPALLFGAGVKSRLLLLMEDRSASSALAQDLINSSAIRIDFFDSCTLLPDANERNCPDPPLNTSVIIAILFYTPKFDR